MHPQPAQCQHRSEITEDLHAVIERLLALHTREMQAVSVGDVEELERLGEEIDRLVALEDSLLERFQAHLKSHGC